MVRTGRLQRPVIAITGSAGKTTTKEMIASVLRKKWRIFKTLGNWNSQKHTAHYVKKIKRDHKAIVLEYGMTGKGHIKEHCQLIKPNIGIITNVGTAHIGNVGGTIKGVAQAKSELIHYMKQTGTLVLNADDRNSQLLDKTSFKGKIITVGIRKKANYQAQNIRYSENGMTFQMRLSGGLHTFFIPIHGRHNIFNALFAIAVAHRLRFSVQDIKAGLRTFRKLKQRLIVYRLKSGIRVIDDTFSANPHAMRAAMDVLSNIGKQRNIAVLGSMQQMGKYSLRAHRDVGNYVAKRRIDYLYTFGKEARQIRVAAIQAGFPANRAFHQMDRAALHNHLQKVMKPGSTVLVKGSHAINMNITVELLRKRWVKK